MLATERALIFVGEAVVKLRKLGLDHLVAETADFIAFRSILIHAYHTLDDETVWIVLTSSLPKLVDDAKAILSKQPPPKGELLL